MFHFMQCKLHWHWSTRWAKRLVMLHDLVLSWSRWPIHQCRAKCPTDIDRAKWPRPAFFFKQVDPFSSEGLGFGQALGEVIWKIKQPSQKNIYLYNCKRALSNFLCFNYEYMIHQMYEIIIEKVEVISVTWCERLCGCVKMSVACYVSHLF